MFSKETYIQRREILKKNMKSNDFTVDDFVWMGDMPSVAPLAAKSGIGERC